MMVARGSKVPRCLRWARLESKLWHLGVDAVSRDSPRAACSCVGIGEDGISCSRESKHVLPVRQAIKSLPFRHVVILFTMYNAVFSFAVYAHV